MPDLFFVLILVVAATSWFAFGFTFGYRMKIRYGSRLHWPDRPLWAERKHPLDGRVGYWPNGIPFFRNMRR